LFQTTIPLGGGFSMTTTKQTVILTDDNCLDFFPLDYPESLVNGLTIGDGGIDRDGREVTGRYLRGGR
jgi:hypothetical protein